MAVWLEQIEVRAAHLQQQSKYVSSFPWNSYASLAKHHTPATLEKTLSGTDFQLINSYIGCGNCHQAFQFDTYERGCLHDCVFCFAREQAGAEWNAPYPIPVDISKFWEIFHTVFETDRPHPWREALQQRVPLRLGGQSDCFMAMDRKFKVTLEALKILDFYRYPFMVVTRSDLIADDEYLRYLDPKRVSVHMSISSLDAEKTRALEPLAPAPAARIEALKKLRAQGIWTVARLSPFFPRHPDGYFSDPHFQKESAPLFDHFRFELIDALASAGTPALLTGFASMGEAQTREMSARLGFDLFSLLPAGSKGFRYSGKEVRCYLDQIRDYCRARKMEFTSCYLGLGESAYAEQRPLWDNREDCCNVKGRVEAHQRDSKLLLGPQATGLAKLGKGLVDAILAGIKS